MEGGFYGNALKVLSKPIHETNQIAHKKGFGEIEMAAHTAHFITGYASPEAGDIIHRRIQYRTIVNDNARAFLKRYRWLDVHTHWHSSGLHRGFLPKFESTDRVSDNLDFNICLIPQFHSTTELIFKCKK
jgi:hypothetical protein